VIFKLWKKIGQSAFFLSIPLLHIYLRAHKRTRVLIVSEGKVLLVKGWLGSGKWILPGGGRHIGESAEQAVIRELREETGITLEPEHLKDVGEAHFARYGLRFTYQQFVAELPAVIKPTLRQIEIVDATWMPLKELSLSVVEYDVLRLIGVWKGLS
jgi:8-oxo-dGTP diphosphatase